MVGKKSGRALLRDEGTSHLTQTVLCVTSSHLSHNPSILWMCLRICAFPHRQPLFCYGSGDPKRHLADTTVLSVTLVGIRVQTRDITD